MTKTVAQFVAAILLCFAMGSAVAQTEQSGSDAAPAAAAEDAIDLTALAAGLRATHQKIADLNKLIETEMKNADQAKLRFDELLQAYEEVSALVGSGSDAAKRFDAFIAQYNGYAEEAAAQSDPQARAFAEDFRALAAEAARIKAVFIQKAALTETQIATLRREETLIIYRYRVSRGQVVVAGFQAQAAELTTATTDIQSALDRGVEAGLPITTGPAPQ